MATLAPESERLHSNPYILRTMLILFNLMVTLTQIGNAFPYMTLLDQVCDILCCQKTCVG